MTERDFRQEVLIVEEELLDEYVSGQLSSREQELFQRSYLSSPKQRQKVQIARVLGRYAAIHKKSKATEPANTSRFHAFQSVVRAGDRLGQVSWAAAIVLIVAGGMVLWWALRSGPADEIAKLNGPGSSVMEPGPTVVSSNLPEIVLRGRNPQALDVDSETKIIQLRINVTSQSSCNAVLRDSAGKDVVRLDDLKVRTLNSGPTIVIQLPSHLLPPADYELELTESVLENNPGPKYYSLRIRRV